MQIFCFAAARIFFTAMHTTKVQRTFFVVCTDATGIFTFCGKSVILENKRNLRHSKEAFEFRIRYVYENIRKIQRHFTFVYGIIKREYDQRKGVYTNEYFVFYHTEK